jgi:hypothetical protein
MIAEQNTSVPPTLPGADIETSIIDSAGENTLKNRLRIIGDSSTDISIASAFFSLDAAKLDR